MTTTEQAREMRAIKERVLTRIAELDRAIDEIKTSELTDASLVSLNNTLRVRDEMIYVRDGRELAQCMANHPAGKGRLREVYGV